MRILEPDKDGMHEIVFELGDKFSQLNPILRDRGLLDEQERTLFQKIAGRLWGKPYAKIGLYFSGDINMRYLNGTDVTRTGRAVGTLVLDRPLEMQNGSLIVIMAITKFRAAADTPQDGNFDDTSGYLERINNQNANVVPCISTINTQTCRIYFPPGNGVLTAKQNAEAAADVAQKRAQFEDRFFQSIFNRDITAKKAVKSEAEAAEEAEEVKKLLDAKSKEIEVFAYKELSDAEKKQLMARTKASLWTLPLQKSGVPAVQTSDALAEVDGGGRRRKRMRKTVRCRGRRTAGVRRKRAPRSRARRTK